MMGDEIAVEVMMGDEIAVEVRREETEGKKVGTGEF